MFALGIPRSCVGVSPLTSGRLSHSSEPLSGGASLTGTDSPPISPSDEFDDVVKVSDQGSGPNNGCNEEKN
ncbi:hypothetical protein VIGAN_10069200 [Vigna angularis var. angularis]|uniref:Uncharacterized protein n=1 Tax=Vigna angularis var. angularis TaxID=157739 RepID=A0A0S3T2H7_PHAAN|nr:hypothetical protein VIGAN_10069200 [Vigna angularis var. angularis]